MPWKRVSLFRHSGFGRNPSSLCQHCFLSGGAVAPHVTGFASPWTPAFAGVTVCQIAKGLASPSTFLTVRPEPTCPEPVEGCLCNFEPAISRAGDKPPRYTEGDQPFRHSGARRNPSSFHQPDLAHEWNVCLNTGCNSCPLDSGFRRSDGPVAQVCNLRPRLPQRSYPEYCSPHSQYPSACLSSGGSATDTAGGAPLSTVRVSIANADT